MIKKEIKYTNFNNEEKTKTCYFNLSEAELAEMSVDESFVEKLQKLTAKPNDGSTDNEAILKVYKDLILKSYGEKSEDGESFIKEDENGRPLSYIFKQSAAFTALFMELTTNIDMAIEFTKGVLPANVAAEVSAEMDNQVAALNTTN